MSYLNSKLMLKGFESYLNYKTHRYTPFLVLFYITYRCNLRCKKCSVWKVKSNEMNTNQILSMINSLSEIGTSCVYISGGEPLLRNDLEVIGKEIRQKGMIASFITNGTLITKARAKDLVRNFDRISISIDGPEQIDNSLRGKNTFKRSVRGLKYLLSHKGRNAKISICSVVSNKNYFIMEKFFNKFKNKVDYFRFNRFSDYNGFFSNAKYIESWNKMKDKDKNKIFGIKDFVNNAPVRNRKYCDAGKLYISIDPSGNIFPCPCGNSLFNQDSIIGNLVKDDLVNLWKSGKILQFSAKKSLKCRGCYSTCTTEVSQMFRMNPIKLLLNFI